jgi:hypothetical protein
MHRAVVRRDVEGDLRQRQRMAQWNQPEVRRRHDAGDTRGAEHAAFWRYPETIVS